jgi:hypothetical protein
MEGNIRKKTAIKVDPDPQHCLFSLFLRTVQVFEPQGYGSVVICADPDSSINKQKTTNFVISCNLLYLKNDINLSREEISKTNLAS